MVTPQEAKLQSRREQLSGKVAPKRCFMPLVSRNAPLLLRYTSWAARLPACHWLMKQRCLVRRKGRVRKQDERGSGPSLLQPQADQNQHAPAEEESLVIISCFGLSNLETNTLKPKSKRFTRVCVSLKPKLWSHVQRDESINMLKHVY